MNDLKNTYVYNEFSHEDIDIMIKNVSTINKGVQGQLYLMQLNKLPMVEKLVKLVNSNKIRLIHNDDLLHATVRWVADKGYVYCNATPNAKLKRGLEKEYNIASNELYSLIIGGAIFLYSDKFNKDRTYIKDCVNGYMEMMGKAITRAVAGHFSSTVESSKFYFLIGKYLLLHNKTAVTDIDSFIFNLSGISEKDRNVFSFRFNDKQFENLNTFIEEVLKPTFPWMEKLTPGMLIQTIATMYGANNTYMVENIDCIGTIIADHIIGGRTSLFSRYSNLKGIFKSTAYNNILSILKDIQ